VEPEVLAENRQRPATSEAAPLLDVRDLVVRYGNQVAVDHLSFTVQRGEFVAILGASGCGKSTTLRAIAGLERVTSGEIVIDGQLVASGAEHVPPQKRNVNMVFQSYAVWPHMTVFDNVAYGLRGRKSTDIKARVNEILATVGLSEFAHRFGTELSGGQQQRVALARAVATRSALILYDEPLSSLDAALRARMRAEITELHRRLHTTSIYVTHDQSEALTMADKVVVMNAARVMQIGPPREIYMRPRSAFVARFVGLANIAPATISSVAPDGASFIAQLDRHPDLRLQVRGDKSAARRLNARGQIMFRPEAMALGGGGNGSSTVNHWHGTVSRAFYVGPRVECEIVVGGWLIRGEVPGDVELKAGDDIDVHVDPTRAIWLAEEADSQPPESE
jgi:iron(III) transport system ATP-binding protein